MTDFPTIRPAPTSTAERLSTFRLSTFDYKTHWQSGTEPGKMAENRSKNHRKSPGFLPGVLCRGCGGCRLALPGVSVPPAACPLWAALWGVSGLACTPVPLPGCVALCALCGGCGRVLRRGCGGCGLALPGVSIPRAACPLYAAGIAPGAAVLSIARAWSCGRLYGDGQRKARASCTSSTRAQKNRRRDCTRGGSVVSFIHFQKL